MIEVPFIQFHLPDGRQSKTTIKLDDTVSTKLEEIKNAGCRLTAEILTTGVCSFCIEKPEIGDFDMELSPNGPGVKEAVTKMILRFSPKDFQVWEMKME